MDIREYIKTNGRTATFVIAASDSTTLSKRQADYVCKGADDQVQIQAAIDALPSGGGKVVLMVGNYEKGSTVGISLSSNTEMELSSGAIIKLADVLNSDACIFTNDNKTSGNTGIIIRGGILDCNEVGQSSGNQIAVDFENVSGIIDCSIEGFNTFEVKLKNCDCKFINRNFLQPDHTISNCDSLDGWSFTDGTGTLNTDRVEGTHSLNLTTANYIFAEKSLGDGVDFRFKEILIWVKMVDIMPSGLYIWLFADDGHVFKANLERDKFFTIGEWTELRVGLAGFTLEGGAVINDWMGIRTMRVTIAGASRTVRIDKIVLVSAPMKPVVTAVIDDGADTCINVIPISEKYNSPVCLGIWTQEIGQAGRLTLADLYELKKHQHDLLSHTISHPNLTSVSDDRVDRELIESKKWLETHHLGTGYNFFIVPGHYTDGEISSKIKQIYIDWRMPTANNAWGNIDSWNINGNRPQRSWLVDALSSFSVSTNFEASLMHHDWIIVYGHSVDVDMQTVLDGLFEYCRDHGIAVKTFSDIYDLTDEPITSDSMHSNSDLFMDVLAVSATHVRSNEDLSEAIPNTFTLDAQPDVPRTLSGHFDAHANITAYTIDIVGVDAKGNTVTEEITEADGWDWETLNAFATITSIIMSTRTGTGATDTMDIGITDVLGLSNVIYATGDVFKIKKNNANATVAGAQVNKDYDTYDMAVIGLGAGDDFTIWYKSNLNIIT